ncbi:MAG: methyltransferase [Idiomarinaceae bacterium]|nr:methyltransferase [Idiomarinaceae bacterium]
MDDNITYYNRNAEQLAEQYDSLDFEQVHGDWFDELPSAGMALDVGAGSGRDARFLACHGFEVVAVEPADELRERAQQYDVARADGCNPIHWLDDSLPELSRVQKLQTKFDLILLSAVWMHIAPSQRQRAFRKLSSLLKPNGKMVVSLRHGASPDERTMHPVSTDERTMHPVSTDELAGYAQQQGLSYRVLRPKADQLQRPDVQWETVLLIKDNPGD